MQIANFLAYAAHTFNLGQSAVAVYRSAVAKVHPGIAGMSIGHAPLVSQIVKGVGVAQPQRRARRPRYQATWDASIVLDFLTALPNMPIENLLHKTLMFLALSTLTRVSSLANLSRKIVFRGEYAHIYYLPDFVEKSNERRFVKVRAFVQHQADPIASLKLYLAQTAPLLPFGLPPEEAPLFVALRKPHKQVSSATIARWILSAMKRAGIDTNSFKAHSSRAAGAARAKLALSVPDILDLGGWAAANGLSRTFAIFYDKPLS